jgi:hypothetical protein
VAAGLVLLYAVPVTFLPTYATRHKEGRPLGREMAAGYRRGSLSARHGLKMAVFCVVAPRSRAIALMKEAASTSETLVQFCQSTRRNNHKTAIFILATVRTRNLTHLCLFDDSVGRSNAQRRTIESLLDDEFEKVWMEPVVAYFKVLSWSLHVGTEENHDKVQSGQQVSRSTLLWFQILAGESRILRYSCVVM